MANAAEADYTFVRGMFMATTDTPATTEPEQVPVRPATADQVSLSRFDQMVERMKGSGRIVGDIISSDPEIWDCEIE